MKTEHEAMLKSMSQPAKATPQSPRPQSLEFPLSLSNHPVSNEKVVLHDADGMRIAIFELESEAAYVFRAVNAYAALQAENAELREALDRMPCTSMRGCPPGMDSADDAIKERHSTLCAYRIAQEALTRPPEARS